MTDYEVFDMNGHGKKTNIVYNIYFQSPDGMPEWDHQNTPIIFATVGFGLIFFLLLASRNSFQLNRTSLTIRKAN